MDQVQRTPSEVVTVEDTDSEQDTLSTIADVDIAKEQKDDPSLAAAWKEIDEGTEHLYFKNEGTLYRKGIDVLGEPMQQLVVPETRRKQAIRITHMLPMSGHLSPKKTRFRILKRFYWPALSRDVKAACQSCPECQRTARKSGLKTPLVPMK